VEPGLIDVSAPPTFFGQGVVLDGTALALRPPALGDTFCAGVTVRAFPMQGNFPSSMQVDPLGTANVPTSGEVDVLRSGYIAATVYGANQSPARYAPVYLWLGATSGTHVNGGFETVASSSGVAVPAGAGGGGSNTGNGTLTAISAGTDNPTLVGVYTVKFTGATAGTVTDPNGAVLPAFTTLGAYTNGRINFTTTAGGTAFVAGDGFAITITNNTLLMPNSYWMGPADSANVSELAFNI
jgi:hypothetical protein